MFVWNALCPDLNKNEAQAGSAVRTIISLRISSFLVMRQIRERGIELSVRLLDCTLRDGCHVIDGRFGKQRIQNITESLVKARVDIIELGFLKNGAFDESQAYSSGIETVYERLDGLPEKVGGDSFSLMIRPDWYDLRQLSPCNGRIRNIRLAFYYEQLEEAAEAAGTLARKGYRFAFNPVNIMGYDREMLLAVIRKANDMRPFALTMVDTFGSMLPDDLIRIYGVIEENLDPEIAVGLHLHDNLSLAFGLALQFLKQYNPRRDIIIDGSLNGMGRIPGNLCTELIADYINRAAGGHYELSPILNTIERDVMPLKAGNPWGYSIPYFLSASFNLHRSYAEYLLQKKDLGLEEMEQLFREIPQAEKGHFRKEVIERLYTERHGGGGV